MRNGRLTLAFHRAWRLGGVPDVESAPELGQGGLSRSLLSPDRGALSACRLPGGREGWRLLAAVRGACRMPGWRCCGTWPIRPGWRAGWGGRGRRRRDWADAARGEGGRWREAWR